MRGGRNRLENIQRGIGMHPSGITGISVGCAIGVSIADLAAAIPHGQVGITTVSDVRRESGDIIYTSGRSPNHETLTGLTPAQISQLLTPTILNPAKLGESSKLGES
jgi:hypothetical protein